MCLAPVIYDSRNFKDLLVERLFTHNYFLSTIVEISKTY